MKNLTLDMTMARLGCILNKTAHTRCFRENKGMCCSEKSNSNQNYTAEFKRISRTKSYADLRSKT